jgi:histidyl-tRNA synthetase
MGGIVKYQKPKGTRDIFGRELERMRSVCGAARSFFRKQGYREIVTPTFEFAELFTRSIGEHTDIVEKETYTFAVGKKVYELRPEGTASVLRALIENKIPIPARLMYVESMYRKEKPQKGRYREFLQIGVELIGEDDSLYDAEMIEQGQKFLDSLGAENISIEVNSIGCPVCRAQYKKVLLAYLDTHSSDLCADCKRRLQRNFLRIFDCKKETCARIFENAPKITDHLCKDCEKHYSRVKTYLNTFGVTFAENKKLVRGLDYYTRTVFEFKHHLLGAQDTVLAGGRYDLLMKELGGIDAPALGWAMGVARLLLTIPENLPPVEQRIVYYIAVLGTEQLTQALLLRDAIHEHGHVCIIGSPDMSLKQQMKRANRAGTDYTIIYGEGEAHKNVCIVRDMQSGVQQEIPVESFEKYLKSA